MDRRDHLQSKQWVSCQKAHQSRVRQGSPVAAERRKQNRSIPIGGANSQGDALVRSLDAEPVAHVHVQERRHVKEFVAGLIDRAAIGCVDGY